VGGYLSQPKFCRWLFSLLDSSVCCGNAGSIKIEVVCHLLEVDFYFLTSYCEIAEKRHCEWLRLLNVERESVKVRVRRFTRVLSLLPMGWQTEFSQVVIRGEGLSSLTTLFIPEC
jgi:hypothetical protein